MQNEIKPCPFCGGKDTVNLSDCSECFSCVDEPYCDGCNWAKHLIVCNVNRGGCGAASGLYDTEEKAIQAWNRRAEYEDMEEQGLLVRLPCKVGDTIYRCGDPIKKIYEWQIAYVEVYDDETVFVDDSDNTFVEADIGKTVFLTREEAEKVLED